MKNISIVIPVYNAGQLLSGTVGLLIKELDSLAIKYEILLCDDGSSDKSLEIMKEIERKYNNICTFSNGINRGLGFTLKKLFGLAKGKKVIYMDCDLPFGTEIISILMENLSCNDIVVASRYKGSPNKINTLRKITSRLYFIFCKYLLGVTISDIGSGTVAFRKEILDKINITSLGFGVHIEILIKAKKIGARIKEIGSRSYENKGNSFSIIKHGIATIVETFRITFRLYNLRRL